MRDFNQVLNESKTEVLAAKKAKIDNERIAILEAVKTDYMITSKFKELPTSEQQKLKSVILEYWNPKTGLTSKGVKFLNEGESTLTKDSDAKDVKRFIEKTVKRDIDNYLKASYNGTGKQIVTKLQKEIESMVGKRIKYQFVLDAVVEVITPKLKSQFK